MLVPFGIQAIKAILSNCKLLKTSVSFIYKTKINYLTVKAFAWFTNRIGALRVGKLRLPSECPLGPKLLGTGRLT